jgi:hypothetical protein
MHDILDCKTLAYAAQWDALSLASQTLPRSPSSRYHFRHSAKYKKNRTNQHDPRTTSTPCWTPS